MSQDDPKKKKKAATKATVKATTVEAAARLGAVGPVVTPTRMAQPRMTYSSKVFLGSVSARLVTQDAQGRYVLGDRAAAQQALSALGDSSWVADRMAELEDAVFDLNKIPGLPHGFVI